VDQSAQSLSRCESHFATTMSALPPRMRSKPAGVIEALSSLRSATLLMITVGRRMP